MPSRGPTDFFQPTSLLDFKYEQDIKFSQTRGFVCVLPQAFAAQRATDGFSWVNVNNYNGGSGSQLVSFGTATSTAPNSIFVHPLAGGDFIQNSPINQWTSNPTSSSGRWTSARLVSCGIRVIPSGNLTIKQGTLTAGYIPGPTQPATSTSITVPTPSQLRQQPSSYEVQLSGIDQSGTALIWLPLDPMDMEFLTQDVTNSEAAWMFYRNPMYLLFDGINTLDTYRLEVVTRVEYVSTLQFNSWSPGENSHISKNDVLPGLKSATQSMFEVISGQIGKYLTGEQSTTLTNLGGQILTSMVPIIAKMAF